MPITISKITQTKRGRFALFNEDEFLFSLDGETYIKSGVVVGSVLSEIDLRELSSKSEGRKAKDKALRYLSLRDYSSGELFNKLKINFDEHTAAFAVSEMARLDMLNDEQFAIHRAQYLANKGKSRREIESSLFLKGLNKNEIASALEALDQNDTEACAKLIEKSYMSKLEAGQKDKVIAALARRGFSIRDIKKAIEIYVDNSEDYGEYD